MSDTRLHTDNDPFIDDDYTYSRPALPAYADVLAALGNPVDPLAAIAALNAENQLYRKLLGDVLASSNGCWIPYAEIEYALEGERPGEDIVKALATVKAERDSLREQVETLQAEVSGLREVITAIARVSAAPTGDDNWDVTTPFFECQFLAIDAVTAWGGKL